MNKDDFTAVLKTAHDSAAKAAGRKMPEMDANILINLMAEVGTGKKTPEEACRTLAKQYKVPMDAYLHTFARIASQEAVDELLKSSSIEGLRGLQNTGFSKDLVKAAEKAAGIVQNYYQGKIDGPRLLEELWNCGIADVGRQALYAADPEIQNVKSSLSAIRNLSAEAVAYAAAAEAFRILMQAMDDATAQHLQTAQIQSECSRSAELIRKYRMELDETVSRYLSDHISAFESGFQAMDQAILADDTDGYLKGNAEIQKVLGHEAQFETKTEFDDLMNSDDAFKF